MNHQSGDSCLERKSGSRQADVMECVPVEFPARSKVNLATDKSNTGACCAHWTLNSTKQPSRRSKSDLFALVATMKLHGCSFIDEGAHRAASIKLAKTSRSTGVEAKARMLRRPTIKG